MPLGGTRREDLLSLLPTYRSPTLDFEARVPVPFSIFPSSYRETEADKPATTAATHEELKVQLPGRDGQQPHQHYTQEEVRITREEDRHRHRPGAVHHHEYFREEKHDSPIDVAEREYRTRYKETVRVDETVDPPRPLPAFRRDEVVIEETVDAPRHGRREPEKMGYYDDDGHYHSFRHGVHKMADRLMHPEGRQESVEIREVRSSSHHGSSHGSSSSSDVPNTVTIPCHHIRLGDLLILQGRPCQVIRISTSAATGQHRYLGVDLFTRQLHEESSAVSTPAPSVVVQTMLGPVFRQYRVLDMQNGSVVAMTESGDVKQALPVLEQGELWSRLRRAFEEGRGSVRVLVVRDRGQELAVDLKVVHGSRL